MSIEILSTGTSSTSTESFTNTVDYDTVAQTIGLTCAGTGHATLTVVEVSNQQTLGALNCDQYGTTGALTNGASASPVTYSGLRVVVLGPGATGVDSTGKALPTATVPATVVGVVAPPKGTQPGLSISLTWGTNAFGGRLGAESPEERVARMAAESDARLDEIDREMDAMTDDLLADQIARRKPPSLADSAERCLHGTD